MKRRRPFEPMSPSAWRRRATWRLRTLTASILHRVRRIWVRLVVPGEAVARTRLAAEALSDQGAESAHEWDHYRRRLHRNLLHDDVRLLTDWPVVRETMFVGNSAYVAHELATLKRARNRFPPMRAIKEHAMGAPKPYPLALRTSGTAIHHAYHLHRFHVATGCSPDGLKLVLEVGGGYGSMARVLARSGFKGRYVCFDLPEVSVLQRAYLQAVLSADDFSELSLVSELDGLPEHLPRAEAGSAGLLIATWSLSEFPVEARRTLLARLPPFRYFLIAYQGVFGSEDRGERIDNEIHLRDLLRSHYGDTNWKVEPIEHLPGNYYLFGERASSER